jgi:hypothetical protein
MQGNCAKATIVSLGAWALALLITFKNNAAADGFNEIGFPKVFYREFSGKGDYSKLELGFQFQAFIINLATVFVLAIILKRIFTVQK